MTWNFYFSYLCLSSVGIILRHTNGKRPGSPTDRPFQKPPSPGRVKRRGDQRPSGPDNIGKREVGELASEDSNLSIVYCVSGCRLWCQRGWHEMFPVIVDAELGVLSTSSASIGPIQPLNYSVPFLSFPITRTTSYFSRLPVVCVATR
ncbi:hypothetical protein EDD16DRAFT_1659763 [Pisolithus croceorrhizus]|nr:hypothetical protein EDD16DRAFT_1659763 [Pisolithus croceorrhizus]